MAEQREYCCPGLVRYRCVENVVVNEFHRLPSSVVTKLQIGTAVGVPGCTLVFCRHLYNITRIRAVLPVDEKSEVCRSSVPFEYWAYPWQRRRAFVLDLVVTLGVPLASMALCIFNIISFGMRDVLTVDQVL